MDLEDKIYAKWNKSEKNKCCVISLVSGVQNNWIQRTDWWLPEVKVGVREMGEEEQKSTKGTCSYKIDRSWGYNEEHSDYS